MTNYEKSISFQELHKAMLECVRGIRWKESSQEYLRNAMQRTLKLHEDLSKERYKIMPYICFSIFTPKKREIVSTRLRDRIFQRSMCNNGLYHQITRHFIYDNCACLDGKGVHFAKKRLQCHLQRHFRKHGNAGYCLKIDVKKFFPSISHAVAKNVMANLVDDKMFVYRINEIIDSFPDSGLGISDKFGKRGIALGSQVSQLIALAMLNGIDHKIKERYRIKHYVRYMDDLILIHHDKEYLKHCFIEIQKELAKLGLEINPKSSMYPIRHGVTFLKVKFILTATGGIIRRVQRKVISQERKKLKILFSLRHKGRVTLDDIITHYRCWRANMQHSHTSRILFNMDKFFSNLSSTNKGETP